MANTLVLNSEEVEEISIEDGKLIGFCEKIGILGKGGQAPVYKGRVILEEFDKRYPVDAEQDSRIIAYRDAMNVASTTFSNREEKEAFAETLESRIKALATDIKIRQRTLREVAYSQLYLAFSEILHGGRQKKNLDVGNMRRELENMVNLPVGIKVLNTGSQEGYTHLFGQTVEESGTSAVGRFIDEFVILDKLKSVYVPYPMFIASEHGQYYMLLECYDTPISKLASQTLVRPDDEFWENLFQVTTTLEFMHNLGIIHRDIKPDNILKNVSGNRKIAVSDPGLAKRTDRYEVTEEGTMGGTKTFLPPEQIYDFCGVGPWSDIYALGGTLVYWLTGLPPKERIDHVDWDKIPEYLEEVDGTERVTSYHNPEVSRYFDRVIWKMTRTAKEDRYQSIAELVEDLKRVKEGKEPSAPDDSRRYKKIFGITHVLRGETQFGIKTGDRLNVDFMDDEALAEPMARVRELLYDIKVRNMVEGLPEGHFPTDTSSAAETHFGHVETPYHFSPHFVELVIKAARALNDDGLRQKAESSLEVLTDKSWWPDVGGALGRIVYPLQLAPSVGLGDRTEQINEAAEYLVENYLLRFPDGKSTFKASHKPIFVGQHMGSNLAQVVPILIAAIQNGRTEYRPILEGFVDYTIGANIDGNRLVMAAGFDEETGKLTGKKSAFVYPDKKSDDVFITYHHNAAALAILKYFKFCEEQRMLDLGEGMVKAFRDGMPEGGMPKLQLINQDKEYMHANSMDAGISGMLSCMALETAGRSGYKPLGRNLLQKVLFTSLDMHPDRPIAIGNSSSNTSLINCHRVEGLSLFMEYLDNLVLGK